MKKTKKGPFDTGRVVKITADEADPLQLTMLIATVDLPDGTKADVRACMTSGQWVMRVGGLTYRANLRDFIQEAVAHYIARQGEKPT